MTETLSFRREALAVGKLTLTTREAGVGKVLVAVEPAGRLPSATLAALAARHRVVVVELPEASAGDPELLLSDAIDGLGIKRCSLIARAGLAAAALGLAAARRDLVEAAVVIAPSGDTPALGEIELPVLILAGTRDSEAARRLAHDWRAGLVNGHLVLVYDTAAEMDEDRPQAVQSVMADFLDRHDRFIVRNDSGQLFP